MAVDRAGFHPDGGPAGSCSSFVLLLDFYFKVFIGKVLLFKQHERMKMHIGGQIKAIPINRTGHAAMKAVHPLTNRNVYVHWRGFVCSFILRLPIRGDLTAF